MFIAVIAGYVVAALLAFCGLFGIILFLTGEQEIAGQAAFIKEIALAAWPLAAGTVIYLLTQIALLLERQGILTADWQEQNSGAKQSDDDSKLKPPAPLPAGSYFHAGPAPSPPPMPRMTPTLPQPPAQSAETEPSIQEAADIATLAARAAAQEAAEPSEEIKPVIKRRESDLSFFRVD